jgi:hypothetical protein
MYRWKALGEENTLGKFNFGLVHCKSLTSKEKKIGCEGELTGLERDKIN